MTVHPPVHAPLDSLLELVRCPCCMSRLTIPHPPTSTSSIYTVDFTDGAPRPRTGEEMGVRAAEDEGALRCAGCRRSYALHRVGPDSLDIPCLMRADALATLDQDLVVARSDPDSARLDYRRHIAWAERRDRFLAPLVHHTSDPYLPPATAEPTGGEWELCDRFAHDLHGSGTVLDLGCGTGEWTARLARRGLRVVGTDTGLSRLERAATARAGSDQHLLFAQADAMELPLAAASVDGVWCSGAFASVRPDRRTVFFRQVNRALRPGGLLYLGAVTAPAGDTLRRYLLWRYIYRRPVVRGERLGRPPRGRSGGWRYRATITARDLRELCHGHGFRVLALSREGTRLLLLARKERGTDA